MKKAVSLILMLVILLGGSGCMFIRNLRQEMLDYMNEKYDDTFTFVEETGGGVSSRRNNILVSSERFPNARILVSHYQKTDTEEERFSDNYIAFVYEEEVRLALTKATQSVYGDCRVFHRPAPMPLGSDVGPETTLAEYLGDSASHLSAVVFVEDAQEEDRNVLLETFRRELQEQGISLGVTLLYVDPAELPEITDDRYSDYLQQNGQVTMRCDFLLDDHFEFVYANWRA